VVTRVLLVPDGGAEPVGHGPTSLEAAATPVLDRLAGEGRLARVRTIPDGVAPGTEAGVPALLGVPAPARGRLEAAAAGVVPGPGEGAWRLDVLGAGRAPAPLPDDDLARLDAALGELGGRVVRLRGSRLLLIGPTWWGDAPPGPHQTSAGLRELAIGPFGGVAKAARTALRDRVAWPWGALGEPGPPPVPPGPLTVVTPGPGAVAGLGVLLGATVQAEVPDPLPDGLVVVHVPDPDDAAHARDRAGKVAALERVDALAGRLAAQADLLVVCPDHGCDPATGAHTADPVPALIWRPGGTPATAAYAERAVAGLPVTDPSGLGLAQRVRT